MSLLRAHKSVFKLVQDTLSSNDALSHIRCSVGSRFQAEQNPEVIIQQSSFDINDLNTADYESFEISIFCYSNTYTEAANLADTLFLAIQASPLYALTETETLGGETTVTVTNYHLKPLDLYLEHYDEDGYEANVLIRVTESESSSSTGTGGTPPPLGTPVVYYPSSESRIQDLADVNVTSLAEGQILKYDFSENEWVNASLPLLASNGIVSSEVNGVTLLSLSNSLSVGSLASSSDVTVGGDLYFAGSQTKLIRPLDAGVTAGPLTIQSNGDLIVELDENQSNDDPNLNNSFVVKNGANDEVFKITEEGVLTINNQYSLPDADGSANYFLKTDGSGQLYFATQYGTSGNTAGSPPPVIDTIDELLDTQLSALADNQILRYDSSTSKWVNEDLTLAQSIGDLTDVDTTTTAPTNGQALVWNNTNSEWEPGDVGIDGLSSTYIDTDIPQNWKADPSQIIGVGSFGTSGVEIAFGEGHPKDLFFKPDGTRLFMVGLGRDDIQSVDLPTAWDLSSIASTATVTSVDLAGSAAIGGAGFEGALSGMHVANDPNDTATYGKKFFVSGDNKDEVQEYTCTTAWDLSTMSADATAYLSLSSTPHGNGVYSVTFNPDGTIMYVGRAGNPNTFSHFDLSTAWDLSTAVYNSSKSVTISVTGASHGNNEAYVVNVCFNTDGTKAYFTGRTRHDLHTTTLSTAWDLSTYTDDGIPLHLDQGYVEQAFSSQYPSWNQEGFAWPSGLFSTPDYLYVLFNTNDQIIRLDKRYYELSLESRINNKAVFQKGLRSYGEVEVIGTIESAGFRTGGNAYFSGAMNWNGFNSGPAVTKGNSFVLGTSMRSIGFVGINQPSGYGGATSHDINNTNPGTWIFTSDTLGTNNIVLPALSGNVLLDTTPNLYYNRFDSESASKVTGATEDIEYYYTARADGQGRFQEQIGALPASGQTLTRTSYYSDKAFADPDTAADWTQGPVYTSTSLASSISQSADTILNVQSTGTPPLSTKIVVSNHLGSSGFVSGDADGFGGTSVAYSLRLLNHTYGGAAIRVVNDSDVEADIGFDSNYELDTTALLTHCGSGDGYLVKWYDQAKGGSTGDGNDATWESSTSYSSRKPQIVSAGSVITDNGKPCLETIDAGMVMDEQFSASNEYDLFFVAQKTLNNNNHGMIWGTQTGNDCRVWLYDYRLYLEVNNGENNNDGYGDGGANTRWYEMGQLILNVRRDSSDVNTAQRNDVVGDHNYTRNGAMKTDRILNAWNNQAYSFAGNVQEIIMLDGDKSSERSAILSNLNTYYSVY